MRHQDLTANHILESWVYASAAARIAATAFVASDVGRIAYQSDLGSYWRLTSVAPTWARVDVTSTYSQSTPANPTGTVSLTGVMMGLAGAFTSLKSGIFNVIITGTIFNPTAIGDGGKVQLRYGTGVAPGNGVALAGTAIGGSPQFVAATVLEKVPFTVNAIIVGTVGTTYWLDLALTAITGGTATISDITITAEEL